MTTNDNLRVTEGAGVSRIGRARLYTKLSLVALIVSASAFSFYAAYVFSKNVSLLDPNAMTLGFFVSLTIAFMAAVSVLVFSVKLRAIDKYDLIIKLPSDVFDRGRMITSKGGYVTGDGIRAEVTMSDVTERIITAFNPASSIEAAILGTSLCGFAATVGLLYAQTSSAAEVMASLVQSSAAIGISGQMGLFFASVALCTMVVGMLRHYLSPSGSQMFVLSDGIRKFSRRDVESIADRLNVGSSNIAHVKVHRLLSPELGAV